MRDGGNLDACRGSTQPGKLSDLLVLCYHAVSPTWAADLSITPQRLEEQLERLVRRGYRGATFTQAVTSPPGAKTLAVTFDDAYRSVLELAAPILDRLNLPGTVFAPTDYIGAERPMSWPGIDKWAGGPHEHELEPMSWEELGRLAAAGWEVGSHTRSHPLLTQVADDGSLAGELAESKAVIESRLDRPCESIAYPYGDHDDRVVEATAGGLPGGRNLARTPRGRRPAALPPRGDLLRRRRAPLSPEDLAAGPPPAGFGCLDGGGPAAWRLRGRMEGTAGLAGAAPQPAGDLIQPQLQLRAGDLPAQQQPGEVGRQGRRAARDPLDGGQRVGADGRERQRGDPAATRQRANVLTIGAERHAIDVLADPDVAERVQPRSDVHARPPRPPRPIRGSRKRLMHGHEHRRHDRQRHPPASLAARS